MIFLFSQEIKLITNLQTVREERMELFVCNFGRGKTDYSFQAPNIYISIQNSCRRAVTLGNDDMRLRRMPLA